MKNLTLLIAALLVVFNLSAQEYNLRSGQQIKVRLTSSAESGRHIKHAATAIVDENITDNDGNILIKRGTNVELSIDTKHSKGVGKSGFIKVESLSTKATDGQTIFLRGGLTSYGQDREDLALGLGIGAGIVAFPVGLFCLCIRGGEAYIPSNTMLPNIVIDDDYAIKIDSAEEE